MRPRGHAGVTLAVALLALLSLAPPAGAISFQNLAVTPNAGNTADWFDDLGTLGEEFASQATILSSAVRDFETRYALQAGTDFGGGAGTSSTFAFTADYTISFHVNAGIAKSWVLDIETDRIGALTLVDDGAGSARSRLFAVTGTATGGTLGGTLGLASVGTLQGGGGGNTAFSQNSLATLSGTGPQDIVLRFVFTGDVRTVEQGSTNQGDEAAIRMGVDSNLSFFSAGYYPGVGARTLAGDGHFVRVTTSTTPEPGTFMAVTLGLAGLGVVGRKRSAERHARASVV